VAQARRARRNSWKLFDRNDARVLEGVNERKGRRREPKKAAFLGSLLVEITISGAHGVAIGIARGA
jgi:hypothetical protein